MFQVNMNFEGTLVNPLQRNERNIREREKVDGWMDGEQSLGQ